MRYTAFLFMLLWGAVSFAQSARTCRDIQREIQDLQYQRSQYDQDIRQIQMDINLAENQRSQARYDLDNRMNVAITRAGRVSSECSTNIANGFGYPTDQSVRSTVVSEQVNSQTVCNARGDNDPYCIQKRSCLSVAQSAEADYRNWRRNDDFANRNIQNLLNRQRDDERQIRRIDDRIRSDRNELYYCRN